MRSRFSLEWAGIALGAAAQGVWCGVLAAALTGSLWPVVGVFSAAVMVAAAAVTRWSGRDGSSLRRGRLLLIATVALATCALLVAGRAWAHEYVVWQAVRDVVFVAGLGVLGISLGRGRQAPDDAVRRAIRAFAVLCAVLVLAALTGTTVRLAAGAVAAALVIGGLHVAVVRYHALTGLVAENDRLRAWPWLLSVAATIVGVLAVAALVWLVLDSATVHWLLDSLLALLAYALDGLGFVLGWAGAGLLRGVAWLAGLVHLQLPQPQPPQEAPNLVVRPTMRPTATQPPGAVRPVFIAAAAALTTAVSVAVVVLAMRRLRRGETGAELVTEDRESVRSMTAAAGEAMGGLARRLRRLTAWAGRQPRSPADLIRLRYERLEERLTKAGMPRAGGVTVRSHLASCARVATATDADAVADADGAADAAALAGLYELARYSSRVVDSAQAERFDDLARSFGPRSGAAG